jgi:Response regulator containing CheY-like receiver, AAA-type ATPase, and DNA-binding domains
MNFKEPSHMSELKDKLILVVDDEPRMVNFMRMNLELEGCRVISASNGREALEKVRDEMPDVVLLDGIL